MLKVTNLTKKFPKVLAVDNVSFDIGEGEIFSLIGPNGSGKTTIIKMLTGLIRPTKGSIEIGGIDISKDPIQVKTQTAYIPDEPFVWSTLTGLEFLHFVGTLFNIDEEERKMRITKLLDIYNLQGIENSYFEDYSRGNKQKFTILSAFLHNPKIIFIDEPIIGLDPESVEIALREFRRFKKEGGSMLVVTHTLDVAEKISDKIGILKQGKLLTTGDMGKLRKEAGLKEHATLNEIYLKLTEH